MEIIMTKTTSNTTRKTKTPAAKPAKAAGRSKPDSANPADQLSDLQLVALSAACQREDRTITIPDALEDEAIPVFAETLINLGLAEETPAERGQPVWRQDQVSGQPITLCITDRALTVLGIDEGNPETGMGDTEVIGPSTAAPVVSHTSEGGRNVTDLLKAADRARKANAVVSGPGATPAQPRRTEPPQPRAGSKQGQLIAMLSRDEGASISEIATALGWLPHTTRAALTGLRHKGYELGREVNADRGSLYRITAMPIMAPALTDAIQAEAA
jgi:Protein of unknown function (DUF3489)